MKRELRKRLENGERKNALRKILASLPVARNQPPEINIVTDYLAEQMKKMNVSSFEKKPSCARRLDF
jgi:hypothetical protein